MLSGVDSVSILSTHTNAGLNKHATSLYIDGLKSYQEF